MKTKKAILMGCLFIGAFACNSNLEEKSNIQNDGSTAETQELLDCAYDLESYETMQFEVDSLPFGLWLTYGPENNAITQRFYVGDNDRFNLFSATSTLFGDHAINMEVGICTKEDRTFLISDGEYYEFYREGSSLKLSDNEYDPEYPEDRSEFEFYELKPAKVVAK